MAEREAPQSPREATARAAGVALSLEGGHAAEIVARQGDHVRMHAATASPPGSSLRAQLVDGDIELTLKVRGCRRLSTTQPDAAFEIEARLVSPTRALRELLGRLLP